MPSRADTERLRLAQEGVRALLLRDLDAFWSSLNLGDAARTRDALLKYVPLLVKQYGESAAVVAADWYDEVRATEGIPGRFRASMMPSPYQDAAEPTARRAAGALFTARPDDALTSLESAVGKYALAAGRSTITTSSSRDPQSSGWQREVRSGGCDFCKKLAGRGGVYKEATAHFAAHGHCHCAAVPSWDANAPEVDASTYKASERKTTPTHDLATDVDVTRTTEQLRSTLASLEASAAKFETAGTRARIEELRRQIVAR